MKDIREASLTFNRTFNHHQLTVVCLTNLSKEKLFSLLYKVRFLGWAREDQQRWAPPPWWDQGHDGLHPAAGQCCHELFELFDYSNSGFRYSYSLNFQLPDSIWTFLKNRIYSVFCIRSVLSFDYSWQHCCRPWPPWSRTLPTWPPPTSWSSAPRTRSATSRDQRCARIWHQTLIIDDLFQEFHRLSGSGDKTYTEIKDGYHHLFIEQEDIRKNTFTESFDWIIKRI